MLCSSRYFTCDLGMKTWKIMMTKCHIYDHWFQVLWKISIASLTLSQIGIYKSLIRLYPREGYCVTGVIWCYDYSLLSHWWYIEKLVRLNISITYYMTYRYQFIDVRGNCSVYKCKLIAIKIVTIIEAHQRPYRACVI